MNEKEYQEKVEKLRTLFEIEKDEPIGIWSVNDEENDDMEFYHESYVKWLEEKYINQQELLTALNLFKGKLPNWKRNIKTINRGKHGIK